MQFVHASDHVNAAINSGPRNKYREVMADWTTAVIAGAATLVFQGVGGLVRLFFAKRKERRDVIGRLLSVLTRLEWTFSVETEDALRSAGRPSFPATTKLLAELLDAVGSARQVLNEEQVEFAMAVHLSFAKAVEHIGDHGDDVLSPVDLDAVVSAFLKSVKAKATGGLPMRAIGAQYRAETAALVDDSEPSSS